MNKTTDCEADTAGPQPTVFKFAVTLHGDIVAMSLDEIEPHLDAVMAELEHLLAEDPVIEVDVEKLDVMLQVVVEASNPLDAVVYASGQIRAAIHAVGGSTPDWPLPVDDAWGIRLVGVRSDRLPVLAA